MDFQTRYRQLNRQQRQAVDIIEGPVMVIAGPGTGKTELLSMRVANILQKTDTLAENILCLTFTDSGANALRQRLIDIINKDAYKVAIHTFHSFGTEVINQNGQYFYKGAYFRPADEITSYKIIRGIFDELEYSNPLASKINGEYTHLKDTLTTISELKKSGLTSDELLLVLDANDGVIETTETLLAPIFSKRSDKTTSAQLAACLEIIRASDKTIPLPGIVSLSQVLADSLHKSIETAEKSNSTKPITVWRNQWMKKDAGGNFILKSHERQIKLRSVSFIYYRYLARMQETELYDFDDMILRVVHAIEIFDELRFNLQEQYQYILVDEFQDTNMAQMRILYNLTNSEAHGDTPNILVVGDDDQAIYSFQGADVSNIINFRETYPHTQLITLTDNYRSTKLILEHARNVIAQGADRLENYLNEVDKQLQSHRSETIDVRLQSAVTISNERQWLIKDIQKQLKEGIPANDITVLARRHQEIVELLPYFNQAGLTVSYERQSNVLELEPIILIEKLARVIINLHQKQHINADAALPELLSHPAWSISPLELWQLSTEAYDAHKRWFDIMSGLPKFQPLHKWLVELAADITRLPLEQMLDKMIGKVDESSSFTSPLYDYFFSSARLAKKPDEYLLYLEALRTIRTKLYDYQPKETPKLPAFIQFIDLHRQLGSTINNLYAQAKLNTEAINLMTAHKAKGLEFDTVYVIGAVDSTWGERARGRNRLISYPENLPLAPAGETIDERLRLFYVALTRAKRQLVISYAEHNDNGQDLLRAGFLLDKPWQARSISTRQGIKAAVQQAENRWHEAIATPTTELRELLAPTLEHYRLSATHLNNFIDITHGGPQTFLLNNLLRFPQAISPAAAYGSAIHKTLQQAHAHLAATGKQRAIEDILHDYELALRQQRLADKDFGDFLQKGVDILQVFLAEKYNTFSKDQRTELSFTNQQSLIGQAQLTGMIDLADINETTKTITVTDYKTGKPARSWTGKSDYEKIKLHKYKQQLLFYKLLIENSRTYGKYTVERGILQFIEPDINKQILELENIYDKTELDNFTKLVQAVWQHIINLDLPNIGSYEPTLKGILVFEQDLIDNTI
jgi:DNA helicase-2/ATP-dependent DNA helicase PcrA